MKWILIVIVLAALAFVGLNLAPGPKKEAQTKTATSPVVTDEIQYLIFAINVSGSHSAAASIDSRVADVIDKVGMTGDGKHQLGFMVSLPAWMWDSKVPDHTALDEYIRQAFAVAKKREVAVYFTLIDSVYGDPLNISNWWDPSQPGYNPDNKKNVEWSDWDGTPTKARYALQAGGAKLPPIMCYNSPEVLSETSYLATKVVGPGIVRGINDLKSSGQENLFGGITLSPELSLDDYSVVGQIDPNLAHMMDQDGAKKVRLGYCALTNLGYSKTNPPANYADALAKVNQSYAAYWAEQLVSAGISKDKLYGHVAAEAQGAMLQYSNAPIWTVFNDYSRPGWTTYADGALANNFNPIYDALAEHGNPHWGSTEGSPTTLSGKSLNPEAYLAWHYNHGATVVVINAGDTSKGGQIIAKDIWSPKSIAAYKKFLSGESLQE